ncbi:hypothetical protein H4F55_22285, partial [Pectobacterium brasiliense]|nr:hypothetical protein [Pectobacterium brasiliense]
TKVAGVGIDHIGGDHHDGRARDKQPTPRYDHTFGLKKSKDSVIEEFAKSPFKLE